MPVNLTIHSNIHDYDVFFEDSPDFIQHLAIQPNSCYIVDENVWTIYQETLLSVLPKIETIILPINEDRKNLATVQELYDQLVERPAKRNMNIISIGGGILQDITGFAASTIYRGVNWIFVPTTLLAQADSCIGSKTSLNYHKYKNLIGTFYPPANIHIFTQFLQSQSDSDFSSGFGEVIKLHLMGGRDLFSNLVELSQSVINREPRVLHKIVQQSLNVKLSYMSGDEFDTGRRNLLNYGHDFGHALESTSSFAIPHGQAVIFGMLAANIIARKRGLLSSDLEKTIANKLLIPNWVSKPTINALGKNEMIDAMKKDKKRTGNNLALIMMNDTFEFTRVNDLFPDEAASALAELQIMLN